MFTSQKAFMKLIVSDVSTPLFCRAHNESLANNFSWIICCMNPTPFPAGRSHEYCAIPSIYSVLPKLMEICCSQLALLGWKVRYKTNTASSWLLHQTFPSFGGERQPVCYPGTRISVGAALCCLPLGQYEAPARIRVSIWAGRIPTEQACSSCTVPKSSCIHIHTLLKSA